MDKIDYWNSATNLRSENGLRDTHMSGCVGDTVYVASGGRSSLKH